MPLIKKSDCSSTLNVKRITLDDLSNHTKSWSIFAKNQGALPLTSSSAVSPLFLSSLCSDHSTKLEPLPPQIFLLFSQTFVWLIPHLFPLGLHVSSSVSPILNSLFIHVLLLPHIMPYSLKFSPHLSVSNVVDNLTYYLWVYLVFLYSRGQGSLSSFYTCVHQLTGRVPETE